MSYSCENLNLYIRRQAVIEKERGRTQAFKS